MKLFGRELTLRRAEKQAPFESALQRIVSAQEGYWGSGWGSSLFGDSLVTPENCMRSPTMQAIVTAVSRRISVSPVRVYRVTSVDVDTDETGPSDRRVRKELLANHPVTNLLSAPNKWQSRSSYWLDATSRLLRYGNFVAFKSRGQTGPIRELLPIPPHLATAQQNLDTWQVTYRVNSIDYPVSKLHHVRGPARNGFWGDSPVYDVGSSILLEIAAESFGMSFFQNGAIPLLIFQFAQGSSGFKSVEERTAFVDDFQNALSGQKRHRGLLLPKGIEASDPVKIENDKAQFLETRKYQRTVIAGAFGVPPHLVGDLERATFNNVEQQGADFTVNVVLPIAQQFESAMERDLLTDQDRAGGVIIRFDLDTVQLTDFKSRQEGLLIQRNAGVISPNDWRERENLNPIPEEDGGEDYIRPLNFVVAGSEQDANLNAPLPAAAPAKPNGAAADSTMKELVTALREIKAMPQHDPGDLVDLMEKLAGRQPNIVVNIPELPAPIVHVNLPPPAPMETVPLRDQKTGKVVSLVQRPIKTDKG